MMLQVGGINTHVERLGAGRPLLLLHGWGPGSVTLDKHLLPLGHALKGRYEVTLVEFPGHGKSGMPGADWGVGDYAAWTLQLMDQLALHQPDIVAHSFGGRVALWLAANHPRRVGRLVLTGCAGLRPKKSLRSFVRGRLYRAGRLGLRALRMIPGAQARARRMEKSLRGQFSSADYLATPEALRAGFSKIVAEDLRPLLPKIPQKTLLVWGEKDSATPLWMGEAMAREMPDARLLVYQAEDHFAYNNQLARFVTAVDTFLTEVAEG